MKFTPGATESDARGTEYIEFQMISIAKHNFNLGSKHYSS